MYAWYCLAYTERTRVEARMTSDIKFSTAIFNLKKCIELCNSVQYTFSNCHPRGTFLNLSRSTAVKHKPHWLIQAPCMYKQCPATTKEKSKSQRGSPWTDERHLPMSASLHWWHLRCDGSCWNCTTDYACWQWPKEWTCGQLYLNRVEATRTVVTWCVQHIQNMPDECKQHLVS
jgi:hypothetical protein